MKIVKNKRIEGPLSLLLMSYVLHNKITNIFNNFIIQNFCEICVKFFLSRISIKFFRTMNAQGTAEYLSSIDTRSLVDKVEMNMVDFFIKKEYKPGDVIPKEMELANAMGVSRTVIRESLTRLKTLGIIESIKHKGTIIKSPDLSALLAKSMIPRMLDNSTLKDIFELRLVIEIGMADLIFQHVSPEDIADLQRIINKEPEKSDDVLFDIDHEIKFHGKL